MIKNHLKILLLIISSISVPAYASQAMLGERLELDSITLNEKRNIQVLLPENYNSNTSSNYPVIYLLDGDYNFNAAAGILDFLSNKAQLIPDVILVGIADKGTDRYRQFMTPDWGTAPLKPQDAGKASEFLTFLDAELKPFIDKNYRTADTDILFGHSVGGLFVLNTLVESPESFDIYLASSPSVWLNEHAFVKKAKPVIENSSHGSVDLYLSLGDETRMGQYGFINLLDDLQPKNINWSFKHYPDENHNSVGMISLRNSLKHIFKGWFISDRDLNLTSSADALVAHYQQLSSKFNFNQPIPTTSVMAAIRYFYRNDKQTEIDAFLLRVKQQLPSSEQAFTMMHANYQGYYGSPQDKLDTLLTSEVRFKNSIEFIKAIAVAYEQLDQQRIAYDYYQKALTLANEQAANHWQINIIEAKLLLTQPANQ